jgi:hypothetical protein
MAKASERTDRAVVAAIDKRAREIWRYGEEGFSAAWIRAYEIEAEVKREAFERQGKRGAGFSLRGLRCEAPNRV